MAGPEIRDRQWTEDLSLGSVRLRCAYCRRGKRVLRFTVQMEVLQDGKWRAVVRYDNAHGFCHRDTIHADGTQDKTGIFIGNVSATFTYAIEDLKAHWSAHYERFVQEMNND